MKVLVAVGWKDGRTMVCNMLRRIIADNVAELYSLTGKTIKSVNKQPFSELGTYKLIHGKYTVVKICNCNKL